LLPRRPDSKPACGLHTYSLPEWNADANTNGYTNGNAKCNSESYADSHTHGYCYSDAYA
jgi:hypothetical protein